MSIIEVEDISAKMDNVNKYLENLKRTFQTTSDRINSIHSSTVKNSKSPSFNPTHSTRDVYDKNMTITEDTLANMERVNAKAREIQEKSLVMIQKTEEIMSLILDVGKTMSNSFLAANTLERLARDFVKTNKLIPTTPEQKMAYNPGNVYPSPSSTPRPSGEHKGGKKKRKAKRTRKRY